MAQLSPSIEVHSSRFTVERRITIVVNSITGVGDDGPSRAFITTLGGQSFAVKETYAEVMEKIAAA